MATLPISDVVDVVVNVSPLSAPRRAFDLGLIIGSSAVIEEADRVQLYSGNFTDAMLEAGFADTDEEYQAALIYAQQNPKPTKVLIGRISTTSILTVAIADAGTGYEVGDELVISGGTNGVARVDTVGTSGEVTAITLITGGYGYTTGTGVATTSETGTGATLDITAGTESFTSALRACRLANAEWYGAYVCGVTDEADVLELSAYAQQAEPTMALFYDNLITAGVLEGYKTNILAQLVALKYNKVFPMISKTAYKAVSAMAYALRNNTQLANSAYTMKFKQLPGCTVDNFSATEVANIEKYNGNVYINRGSYYDMLEQGTMPNGQFFDEVLSLDMIKNDIQLNIMDKLYKAPKVPQTESGITTLVDACNSACQKYVTIGFLAPGLWTGDAILNLKNGDLLNTGYLVQSEAINNQSVADREARKAPPIYVAIKEAGAIHSVTIGVYVVR